MQILHAIVNVKDIDGTATYPNTEFSQETPRGRDRCWLNFCSQACNAQKGTSWEKTTRWGKTEHAASSFWDDSACVSTCLNMSMSQHVWLWPSLCLAIPTPPQVPFKVSTANNISWREELGWLWQLWYYLWGIWGFPKMGLPQNGWFVMKIPIYKMDDN
jgi:hypothetical protein